MREEVEKLRKQLETRTSPSVSFAPSVTKSSGVRTGVLSAADLVSNSSSARRSETMLGDRSTSRSGEAAELKQIARDQQASLNHMREQLRAKQYELAEKDVAFQNAAQGSDVWLKSAEEALQHRETVESLKRGIKEAELGIEKTLEMLERVEPGKLIFMVATLATSSYPCLFRKKEGDRRSDRPCDRRLRWRARWMRLISEKVVQRGMGPEEDP